MALASERGAEGGEAEIAVVEVALFELLVAGAGRGSTEPREMDLAVAADLGAVGADSDGAVERRPSGVQLGIADVEADPVLRAPGRKAAAPPGSAWRVSK